MSRLFRKAVLLLVFVIAVLQIIHMSLMSRLETKKKQNANNKSPQKGHILDEKFASIYTSENVIKDREQMYKSLQSLSSVLDSSGEYRILSFLSTSEVLKSSQWRYSILNKIDTLDGFGAGNNLYRRNDVSVVSHSTIYQLYNLDLLSQKWYGLISLSMFAVSIQQLPIAIEIILLLRYCRPSIRHKTSFHLIYPLSLSAKLNNRQAQTVLDFLKWPDIIESYPDLDKFVSDANCLRIKSAVQQLAEESINYNHNVPYPNNLLRNIARRYALTEYTLVIDVDLVPSTNLYENFLEFGKRTKLFKETETSIDHSNSYETKVVFVVPTYEIDFNLTLLTKKGLSSYFYRDHLDEDDLIPQDKKELIVGIEHRYIRPFYIELCWKCQKYTDYEAWLHASSFTNSSSADKIDILFEVLWHDPWEPFYISRNNVPFYDERFQQYGFNRISQVCELNMAGYKFAVLNNAFLVHKGFKTPNNFHPDKDIELEHNRILFRQFKLQLKDRYPASTRRC